MVGSRAARAAVCTSTCRAISSKGLDAFRAVAGEAKRRRCRDGGVESRGCWRARPHTARTGMRGRQGQSRFDDDLRLIEGLWSRATGEVQRQGDAPLVLQLMEGTVGVRSCDVTTDSTSHLQLQQRKTLVQRWCVVSCGARSCWGLGGTKAGHSHRGQRSVRHDSHRGQRSVRQAPLLSALSSPRLLASSLPFPHSACQPSRPAFLRSQSPMADVRAAAARRRTRLSR